MARYPQKESKEPGANRRAILNALEAVKRPKVDVKDTKAVEERIMEYFQYCIENDVSPSVSACCSWLGIHITTIEKWYQGQQGSPEHQRIAAKFYGIIQDIWAQKMDGGDINPVSGIFMGKAFFGYKDTQEIVVNHTVQNEISTADLIAESRMLPGAENIITDNNARVIEDVQPLQIEQKEECVLPADYDPRYQKAADRKHKQDERHQKALENKAKKPEYLKNYFQEHKEEYNERHRKYRAEAKERAQKEAEQAQKGRSLTRTLTRNS